MINMVYDCSQPGYNGPVYIEEKIPTENGYRWVSLDENNNLLNLEIEIQLDEDGLLPY